MELPFKQERFLNTKYFFWLFLLWQAISVFLMAVGVWPLWVTWITIGVSAAFVVSASSYNAVLLLILSLPFYTGLPYLHQGSIASWRVLFILAFLVWVSRYIYEQRGKSLRSFRRLLNPWDAYALALFGVMALSGVMARFPAEALKQIIFLLNAYFIYLIIAATVKTRGQVLEIIKYTTVSLSIIVGIGYIQLFLTFAMSQVFFWQYWATHVSQLYYGIALAHVLTYSNSWFSYTGGATELRMFSIMPDSHSFAVVGVFLTGFLLALTALYLKGKKPDPNDPIIKLPSKKSYVLWNAIRLTGLTIILSGTRGVWVGLLLPLIISAYAYFKGLAKPIMKKMIMACLLIIFFFILSPVINGALDYLRVSKFQENFLDRARSIYDLNEDSNVGRLIIWKSSLRYAVLHPFGVGQGNFVVSLVDNIPPHASFGQVAQQNNLRYNLPQKFVSAHSLYLHLLVELGILGLVVFLAYWGSYFIAAYRFFKQNRHEDSVYTTFVVVLGFVFIWLLGYSIFDVTLFNDKILIYSFISLALTGAIIRLY